MNELCISTGYTPRPGQAELHKKMRRFNVLNIHRRWGKSYMCVNHMLDKLLRCELKNPQGAFVAQNYSSAKRIIWQYLKDAVEVFPGVKINESELVVRVPRPDRGDFVLIQLLGSERYDSLRGMYFDGIIFDEMAFCDPTAWNKIVRPALADRNGWAILISTPNGKNHFHSLYHRAEKAMLEGREWFAKTIRASESGILSKEELDEIRDTVGEEAYAQEFECSFFADVKGAYYKSQLEKLRKNNQIRDFPIDVSHEVHIAFDLGMGDSTAMWFIQVVGNELHWIDYYEDSGKGLEEYVKVIKDKPYVLGECILPHDANVRELGTGLSRVETLRGLGLSRLRVLPRQTIEDGVNALRMTLPRSFFHETNCKRGLECLYSYRKEYNEKMGVFLNKPLHNWASHGADAARYGALGLSYIQSKARRSDASLPRVSNSVYDIYGV